jgi:hypothetical protein
MPLGAAGGLRCRRLIRIVGAAVVGRGKDARLSTACPPSRHRPCLMRVVRAERRLPDRFSGQVRLVSAVRIRLAPLKAPEIAAFGGMTGFDERLDGLQEVRALERALVPQASRKWPTPALSALGPCRSTDAGERGMLRQCCGIPGRSRVAGADHEEVGALTDSEEATLHPRAARQRTRPSTIHNARRVAHWPRSRSPFARSSSPRARWRVGVLRALGQAQSRGQHGLLYTLLAAQIDAAADRRDHRDLGRRFTVCFMVAVTTEHPSTRSRPIRWGRAATRYRSRTSRSVGRTSNILCGDERVAALHEDAAPTHGEGVWAVSLGLVLQPPHLADEAAVGREYGVPLASTQLVTPTCHRTPFFGPRTVSHRWSKPLCGHGVRRGHLRPAAPARMWNSAFR